MCWREHTAEWRGLAAPYSTTQFFVPDDPVPKARPRSTKTGFIYTPTKTLQAEWRIRTHAAQFFPTPHGGPISLYVRVLIRPPQMPKKWQGIRMATKRPDIDNYEKTVLDALNGVAYVDDAQVVECHTEKRYAWDHTPGWLIAVHELTPPS